MRVTTKTIGLGLFICLTLLVQNAGAAGSLPSSTYGEDNGWEGYKYYNENGFDLVISFNVYDTLRYPNEFVWEADEIEKPDTDRYIYAYQIFSNPLDTKDISYFSILDINKDPIFQSSMHATTTQPDEQGVGIAPDPLVSIRQGAWEWSLATDFLAAGKSSTYLIFSSPYAPTKGTFEVKSSADTQGEPPVPEPGTIAFLSIGALIVRAITRKHKPQLI